MKPWTSDAGDLNPQDLTKSYICTNGQIDEYLNPGSHERKLFLVGAKGCGKTLLLRYKAHQYWTKFVPNEEDGTAISASNELVESLDFNMTTIPSQLMYKLADFNTWVQIWNFALALIIIRRTKVEFPEGFEDIEKAFPVDFRLSNIITELINEHNKYIFSNFFNRLNRLMARINLVKQPFILFIDRLDQALDSLFTNEEYRYLVTKEDGNIPYRAWQSAQFGLLVSSYNFSTANNKHIKIFASARIEAINVESQLSQNIRNYCTFLEYTKEEVRKIFENNIRYTKDHLMKNTEKNNLYNRFVGFEYLPHIRVRDENNELRQEHLFDFIYRHTFGRPREAILIGSKIYEDLLMHHQSEFKLEHTVETVRRIVNDASHNTILNDYLTEVIPVFDNNRLDNCATFFRQNLISQDDIPESAQDDINYLYRIGLIGFVEKGKQRFVRASYFIHNEREQLRQSDFYFPHPSLDKYLKQKHHYDIFYNKYNIIGDGYSFYLPQLFMYRRNGFHPVSYYLPRIIPGRDTIENNWKTAFIFVSPEKLFSTFFIEEKDNTLIEDREEAINRAFNVLSLVLKLYIAAELRTQKLFSENLKDWEQSKHDKLFSLYRRSTYSAQITQIDNKSLKNLESKLFGRIVLAGLMAYTKLDYTTIDRILDTFTFVPNSNVDKEEASVRQFRIAFFMAGLPNSAVNTINERRRVLDGLSEFEVSLLLKWYSHFYQHDLLVKTLNPFTTDQLHCIVENILPEY